MNKESLNQNILLSIKFYLEKNNQGVTTIVIEKHSIFDSNDFCKLKENKEIMKQKIVIEQDAPKKPVPIYMVTKRIVTDFFIDKKLNKTASSFLPYAKKHINYSNQSDKYLIYVFNRVKENINTNKPLIKGKVDVKLFDSS